MGNEIHNIITTITVMVTIFVSIWSVRTIKETSSQAYNEKVASIYERFSSGVVLAAREEVWYRIMPKYFDDLLYYSSTIYYQFDNSKRESLSQEELKSLNNGLHRDRAMISNLIDFYCYIFRLFKKDKSNLMDACNQYFYHWWRGFLLSYALSSKSMWSKTFVSESERLQFPLHINLLIILEIDRIVMNEPYDPSKDVVLKGFSNIEAFFPDLDAHNKKWPM